MRPLSGIFQSNTYPDLLVGLDAPDDSAVYRINAEQAIISTMDFFPPVVDDPYDFGAIAAANALSDIYAMGGTPLMAINLVAYPDGLGMEMLTEILRGGAEMVRSAGAVIAGGHTVTDKEPKYGLSVTGTVHPDKIITKGGAKPGDKLILTKPLGVGVITTAIKQDVASPEHISGAITMMKRLNASASQAAHQVGVNAMTDITGYSLLGHAHEMAHLSNVQFVFNYSDIPWLDGAQQYAQQDIFPGGKDRNKLYFEQWTHFTASIKEYQQDLLFDPQTSGGLLIAVDADRADQLLALIHSGGDTSAAVVGDVQYLEHSGGTIRITPEP